MGAASTTKAALIQDPKRNSTVLDFVVITSREVKTVKEVTKYTLEADIVKDGVQIVKFYSCDCGPCKMLNTQIPKVEEALGVEVLSYNTDGTNMTLADTYDVMQVPQLVVFENGKEIDRIIGFKPAEAIIDALVKHIPK